MHCDSFCSISDERLHSLLKVEQTLQDLRKSSATNYVMLLFLLAQFQLKVDHRETYTILITRGLPVNIVLVLRLSTCVNDLLPLEKGYS